jgi:hypothetical protein
VAVAHQALLRDDWWARTVKSCGPGIPTLMLSRADDDQRDDGGQQARCTEEITYKP